MIRDLYTGIRMTLVLWVITAMLYPLVIWGIGQAFFPYQATGSLLRNPQGEVIGSELIGQAFSADRYFWSRPSTVQYSTEAAEFWLPPGPGEDTVSEAIPSGASGASNLAPSNPELLRRVQAATQQLQTEGIQPTPDLVYASGSGLDPHITVAAALAQVNRIAQARSLPPQKIQALIEENTQHRFLGIFGEPGVNVLRLNLALDAGATPG